uniref:(northern house mosquito) hypothetical protein n=1 Tax=Culex pipiens TaxID=7175 RepID=A0A8D8ING5_CULPI
MMARRGEWICEKRAAITFQSWSALFIVLTWFGKFVYFSFFSVIFCCVYFCKIKEIDEQISLLFYSFKLKDLNILWNSFPTALFVTFNFKESTFHYDHRKSIEIVNELHL